MKSFIDKVLFGCLLFLVLVRSSFGYVKPDAFMDLGFDALAIGLGYSNITGLPRPDAVYRNPALLANIYTKVYTFNYVMPYKYFFDETKYVSGISYYSFALARNISKNVTLGGGLNYLMVMDIPRTDETGDTILSTFNSYLMGTLFGVGYSYKEYLKFGATVKMICEKLGDDFLYMLPTLSIGSIYTIEENLKLGANLQNVFPQKLGEFKILPTLDVGFSYRLDFFEFSPSVEFAKDIANLRLGLLTYFDPINFALGYNLDFYTPENNRLSFGFNVNLNSIEVSYSIVFLNLSSYLSPSHYITLLLWY